MCKFTFITLILICLLLAGCADDIPGPLTEQNIKGMLTVIETVTEIRQKDGMRMRLIPAGEFQMGSNDGDSGEKPVHTVYLDAYYIDETEVTNEQYCAFLNDYGKDEDAAGHKLLYVDPIFYIDPICCRIKKVGNTYKPKSGYEKHPVIYVTWYGAAAYAQWLGARLPTEAEWEKAARGGLVGKKYPRGDDITHDEANYSGTGGKDQWGTTSPVGSFTPNGYGLFDMVGNVLEWCADEYDSSYYSEGPRNNPKGPGVAVTFKNDDFINVTTRRVLRGGTWYHPPNDLRCANRFRIEPTYTLNIFFGFRCSQEQ